MSAIGHAVNSVVNSDWIEFLRQLPDESVQCCVTSPPYWGLRDYGTATWEGGSGECDHKQEPPRFNGPKQLNAQVSGHASKAESNARTHCKCGARRIDQQLGLERTPEEYAAKMVAGFREVRRVLRKDGTLWLNLGDSYAANRSYQVPDGKWTDVGNSKASSVPSGMKPKDLCGISWMVAFALRADGWYLRQDIVWSKPNPMPESVTDRCTKAHEYLFLLTKSERYFCDMEAIKEASTADRPDMATKGMRTGTAYLQQADGGYSNSVKPASRNGANSLRGQGANRERETGAANRDGRDMQAVGVGNSRNKRSVWEIATAPFPEAHFATFPPKLVEPCILAGTSEKGCCPECGAPWERITESKAMVIDRSSRTHELGRTRSSGTMLEPPETRTTGWQPTCTCNAGDPVPCVVMDPFSGAGTVKLVALAHRRQFIGCELNPDYIEISNRRTWSAENGGMKPPDEMQLILFSERSA